MCHAWKENCYTRLRLEKLGEHQRENAKGAIAGVRANRVWLGVAEHRKQQRRQDQIDVAHASVATRQLPFLEKHRQSLGYWG